MSAYTWPPDPSAAPRLTPNAGEPVSSAVLVPLFRDGDRAHLVLTRRRADLRRHAGEISFPGGRHDPGDADLAETALREAEEEIGLARSQVQMIGELPATSTFATNYLIHPFVATIPPGVIWELSPKEVDTVLELAVDDVRAGRTITTLKRRGITFQTDAYVVGERPHLGRDGTHRRASPGAHRRRARPAAGAARRPVVRGPAAQAPGVQPVSDDQMSDPSTSPGTIPGSARGHNPPSEIISDPSSAVHAPSRSVSASTSPAWAGG